MCDGGTVVEYGWSSSRIGKKKVTCPKQGIAKAEILQVHS